jgi:hypothetical protein
MASVAMTTIIAPFESNRLGILGSSPKGYREAVTSNRCVPAVR